jgi:hypothetical protein
MGFPKAKATSILKAVFNPGNKLALLTAVDGDSGTEVSGSKATNGYERYAIKATDFEVINGVATTKDNILFGLATESWGQIAGFAVYSASGLEYIAELKEPKTVGANTVPVFKVWDEGKQEGIRVTLDVETAAAASVSETN